MKRTLSIVLVVAMLLTGLVFAIPTGAAATAKNIEYVEALYFASAPTIDGFISDAEWGTATFTVSGNDVATVDDSQPFSRFMYWNSGEASDYRAMSYSVWLRWDENYFYIGAKVNDPDGHSLKNGTSETWNGDAIQTRIDEEGPNAICTGADFVYSESAPKPWGTDKVPDLLFGYVEIAGGFSEAWDNSSIALDGGHGMTSFSSNPLGTAQCVVAPAGSSYSTDTSSGITTYEIAIPWTYIFYNERAYEAPKNLTTLTYQNYVGGRNAKNEGIGRVLGMSLVVLDAQANSSSYDAYITWGSGITHDQWEKAPQTCTGSNSVTLSATKVDPSATSYTKYDPASLLDAKFDATTIKSEVGKYFDYLAGDTGKTNKLPTADKLMTVTYDDEADLAYWGGNDPAGSIIDSGDSHGKVLYYPTDVIQTYLCTSDSITDYLYPLSYTFQFDIRYTGTEVQESVNYPSSIYNWFGGSKGYAYQCGYYFNDGQFKIVNEADGTTLGTNTYNYDLKKNNWYTWRFQYDNQSCTMRLWIDDLSTESDNAGDNQWGTMVFNTCWRYFYYSDATALKDGTMMLFRQLNTQVQYDNVKIYNFASYKEQDIPTETPGGTGGTTTTEKVDNGTVDTSNAYWSAEDQRFHLPILVTEEFKAATALSFTIGCDSAKAAYDSVKGLDEGTYTIQEQEDGTYLLTITDFTAVRSMNVGDTYFEILFTSVDGGKDPTAIGLDVSYVCRYTVTTGDGLVYIVIAAAVMTLGCAIVIKKRKSAVR